MSLEHHLTHKVVITSSSTFPLEWQCPQPNLSGPQLWGQANLIPRTSDFYCGGPSLFVCKIVHLPASPPSPSACLCEGGEFLVWPPPLLIHVPRYQGSAALRCWELKCEELSRWRHYAMAIVTPLVDNFYFAATAFIFQVIYWRSLEFVLLRISASGIGNSVRVWCTVESLCHRISALQLFIQSTSFCWADLSIHLCLVLSRQSSEAQAVTRRNSLVSLLTHDVLF